MRNRKIRLLNNLSPVIRELLLLREAEALDRSAQYPAVSVKFLKRKRE